MPPLSDLPARLFRTYREGEVAPEEIKRGLALQIASGSLGFVWFSIAVGMPFTMFLERMGATGFQIGLSVTVQQLAIVIQIPAAVFGERLPARKPFWAACALVHRAMWLLPGFLPLAFPSSDAVSVWVVVVLVAASSLLANCATPMWLSWMSDFIPADSAGRFWGVRQTWTTLVFMAAMWGSGAILDAFASAEDARRIFIGFFILLGAAALFGMGDILLHVFVPEPAPRTLGEKAACLSTVWRMFRNKDFRLLTVAMALWHFGIALTGAFSLLYMKEELGMCYAHVGVYVAVGALGAFAFGVPLGLAADRIGPRALSAILLLTGPAISCAWFFIPGGSHVWNIPLLGARELPNALAFMLLPNFVSGGLYAGVLLCQMHMTSIVLPKEGRTLAMALHWSAIGVVTAIAPLAAGEIMDWMRAHPLGFGLPSGLPFSFFHALFAIHVAMAWMAIPCVLGVRAQVRELSIAHILSLMRIGNPFRVVTYLYNASPGLRRDE